MMEDKKTAAQRYLLNGRRFKMNFNNAGNVTCFGGTEKDLQGQWVALVNAENDQHLSPVLDAQKVRDEAMLPFAWVVINDSTGEWDGGEPIFYKHEADRHIKENCLPGWHLETLYRMAAQPVATHYEEQPDGTITPVDATDAPTTLEAPQDHSDDKLDMDVISGNALDAFKRWLMLVDADFSNTGLELFSAGYRSGLAALQSQPAKQNIEEFLRKIAYKPAMAIISTQELTGVAIAEARACGRMLVLDGGLGFAVVPLKLDLGTMRKPESQPAISNGPTKSQIIRAYNCGYHSGHHDTVEGQYTHIYQCDMSTYHEDVVDDMIANGDISLPDVELLPARKGDAEPFKFVNYSALSEANRQVSQEMKDLQTTFDNLKQNSSSESPGKPQLSDGCGACHDACAGKQCMVERDSPPIHPTERNFNPQDEEDAKLWRGLVEHCWEVNVKYNKKPNTPRQITFVIRDTVIGGVGAKGQYYRAMSDFLAGIAIAASATTKGE